MCSWRNLENVSAGKPERGILVLAPSTQLRLLKRGGALDFVVLLTPLVEEELDSVDLSADLRQVGGGGQGEWGQKWEM